MLTIVETTKNLGNIPYNVPVTISFNVINETAESITITNVNAGCGCTKPYMSVNPIPPHSTAQFNCVYNANSMGSNHKSASYTEKNQPSTTVYFSANVV
jgi:Protein of unknown function (DUF1573)